MPRRVRRLKFYDSSRLNTVKLMKSLEDDWRKKEAEQEKNNKEANNTEKDRN